MNYNYFMTPVGSDYWKTFGGNILIGFWLPFPFYGVFLTRSRILYETLDEKKIGCNYRHMQKLALL